jgi:hypothetical protein
MSQRSVRQAARRSALDAEVVLRKERADRERRLEGLAVAVLTAIGERDSLVRDAERRAAQAVRLTDQEGLSIRDVVEWCGGAITSGGDALAPTGERSPTRAIAPRPGVGHGEVLSGRPETPAFVRSVASLMTSGCGTVSIYTSDTRGALVDGRSRRADGFCSGLRRSVDASRTPCASCGTSAITRCVGCRIVRMWWPGPWDRALRSGWLLFDLAMTTMHRPRWLDCQVLIHSRSVSPRRSITSVLRLIGGGVGVEGNGEALSA